MSTAAALEKIEQCAGGAGQDPLMWEVGFGDQPMAVIKVAEAECHVGVGAESEVGTQIARRLDDGAAVAFTA